jgi:hypothetical protein
MKIGPVELIRAEGRVRLSASVSPDQPLPDWPTKLWFELPESYAHDIHLGPEPFLVALLGAAMHLGESLEAAQAISPMLRFNLRRYQDILNYLDPTHLQIIPLRVPDDLPNAGAAGQRVATLFSAGVDSLYSLWSHSAQNEPVAEFQINDALYLYYGLRHHHYPAYLESAAHYQTVLAGIGVNLIPMETNIRHFALGRDRAARALWVKRMHRAELASAGLVLGRRLARLYLPSGWNFSYIGLEETGAFTNPMFSTESTQVINQANVETRTEKVKAIADWDIAQQLLHVCVWKVYGLENCGRCPKCVRTRTTLDILSKSDHFPILKTPNSVKHLRWMGRSAELLFTKDNLNLAVQEKRSSYQLLLRLLVFWARLKRFFKRFF